MLHLVQHYTFVLHPVGQPEKSFATNLLMGLLHFLGITVPQKLFCVLLQTQPSFLDIFSPNLIAVCCVHSPIDPEVHVHVGYGKSKHNHFSTEISVT